MEGLNIRSEPTRMEDLKVGDFVVYQDGIRRIEYIGYTEAYQVYDVLMSGNFRETGDGKYTSMNKVIATLELA